MAVEKGPVIMKFVKPATAKHGPTIVIGELIRSFEFRGIDYFLIKDEDGKKWNMNAKFKATDKMVEKARDWEPEEAEEVVEEKPKKSAKKAAPAKKAAAKKAAPAKKKSKKKAAEEVVEIEDDIEL